jgi:tetratricopeptide (TPR) repeat protein
MSEAPLCSRCLYYLAAHSPLLFDPIVDRGTSVIELLGKDRRLMATLDPKKPLLTFDEPPLDWKSEAAAESILKHMGFNGGAPDRLTLGDAELLHDILSHFSQKPLNPGKLESRIRALMKRLAEIPYLPQAEGRVGSRTQPSLAEMFMPKVSVAQSEVKPRVEANEAIELPAPPPYEPEPLPPEPPDSPEPEIPPLEPLPPPPPADAPPESEELRPQAPPAPEVVAAASELEQLQAEIQRLSMLKAQMGRQRSEIQNVLQVERSALEEREVLVTAQATTLQSRAKELMEKEKDLSLREAETARQRRRLDLTEFLMSIPELEKKDLQVLRANYQDLETLKSATLDDLMAVGELGEAKSRELYAALHPSWSDEDEDLATRAQTLLEIGDYHGALQCYDFMLRKSPENENLWFNKAEVLGMIGDREGALQAYSRVLEINKNNAVAWREKADLLFEASRIEEGIRALRSLIEVDRDKIEVVLAKAEQVAARGMDRDAVLLYNAILEAEPGNVKAHLGLGDCLVKLGDCDMADKMYTRALGRDPQNPRALYRKGSILNRRGRWGAALQLFNRAIALDWNYADPWVGKGELLLKQGKPSEALDCYQKAIEFEPSRADAWAGKALVHLAREETEQANAAIAKAEEIEPGSESLKEIRKIVERGAQKGGHEPRRVIIREDSDEILKAVLKDSKGIGESQILRRLADMALDAGDLEEALKGYSEALATDENDADAWCGKGLTLRKMGRFGEAVDAYDRALRIDPNREDAKHGREACAKEEAAK